MRTATGPGTTGRMHAIEPDPTTTALQARIRRRVDRLLDQARPMLVQAGAKRPLPALRFDLRGQAAGQACWGRDGRPELRFNLNIARSDPAAFVEETVTHEVAHLVTFACFGRTPPHGREWRAVMRFLGIDQPQRCHDYAVDEAQVRRQRRWRYRCHCRSHELSTTRHNRLQAGRARYRCLHCGSDLHFDERAGDDACQPGPAR
jgi:SprT protein